MKTNTLFSEQQKFRQLWIWTILLTTTGILLWHLIRQMEQGYSWGGHPVSAAGLIIAFACIPALLGLSWAFRLDTVITSEGVHVRFFPLHRSFRYYRWGDISGAFVRTYAPIWEYGGWGIRMRSGRNVAYNVSGNKGLQLQLKNGKSLLIGTQKPDELERALKKAEQMNKSKRSNIK